MKNEVQNERYNQVLRSAAHYGYDSGCHAAIGGQYENPFKNTDTPLVVWTVCFKMGFDVTKRRLAKEVEAHSTPDPNLSDIIDRLVGLETQVGHLTEQVSDLSTAAALYGSPTKTEG